MRWGGGATLRSLLWVCLLPLAPWPVCASGTDTPPAARGTVPRGSFPCPGTVSLPPRGAPHCPHFLVRLRHPRRVLSLSSASPDTCTHDTFPWPPNALPCFPAGRRPPQWKLYPIICLRYDFFFYQSPAQYVFSSFYQQLHAHDCYQPHCLAS